MKKNSNVIAFALLILAILFTGCAKSENPSANPLVKKQEQSNLQALQIVGLYGEIPLYRTEKIADGETIVSPYISSEKDNEKGFCFLSKTGEIIHITTRIENLRIIRDQSKRSPTIEFQFNQDWLKQDSTHSKYDTSTKWSDRLEDVLRMRCDFHQIILRISPEDLKHELSLPF